MEEKTPEAEQSTSSKTPTSIARAKLSFLHQLFQKKPVRFGVIGVAVALVIAGLGWWGWSNSSLSKLSVDAAVTEGTVQYRLDYDHPWENAQEGMSFIEGAQIRTLD